MGAHTQRRSISKEILQISRHIKKFFKSLLNSTPLRFRSKKLVIVIRLIKSPSKYLFIEPKQYIYAKARFREFEPGRVQKTNARPTFPYHLPDKLQKLLISVD
jgi:hypothetical protein